MGAIDNFMCSWGALRRFQKLPWNQKNVVFYSEGASYLKFFHRIMEELVADHGHTLCYVTSSPADTMLESAPPGIDTYYIGARSALITFFQTLDASVMVMSMPNLESFHFKRSAHPVQYAYIHHSMVSTHMIYRKGAFDHFDAIFCTGPHHIEETRQWEEKHGLKKKHLYEHGYAPLDNLMQLKPDHYSAPDPGDALKVLVAPSWGPNGLLEKHGDRLVSVLLNAGHTITVRPHPCTSQYWPESITVLKRKFSDHPAFTLESSIAFYDSLLAADVMISDWSGVALEFSFGLERPVLFVDVPRKVNNPDYQTIAAVPIEVSIRDRIGAILPEGEIKNAPSALEGLMAGRDRPQGIGFQYRSKRPHRCRYY